MQILIIDNYDSFVYNLGLIVRDLGFEPVIRRNDKFGVAEAAAFDKILLSPGPELPAQAGNMLAIIAEYKATKSILGVCLGHQAIAEVCGADLYNLKHVYHGLVTTTKLIASDSLFENVPSAFKTCRYHSWAVARHNLPQELTITAEGEEAEIMALAHKTYDLKGVQFHPESFLTEHGIQIISNWLHT